MDRQLVIHLRDLVFSDIYSISSGQADVYMNKIIKSGHMAVIVEILEGATLRQEQQADCKAANWLESGRRAGWMISPSDLNKATNKIMGVDMEALRANVEEGFPPIVRFDAVKSGKYIGSRCRL